jgi:hypothetical protein
LAAFFASEKNHHIFFFGPCQAGKQTSTYGGVKGSGDAISKRQAEELPPVTILLFLPIFKQMIFSLSTLTSFNIRQILMADLLLHISKSFDL